MGKSSFIPHQMLNRLTFFKPMGPNQPQIGQSWYQSTPLHLYIQNIMLVLIEVKFEVDWNGKIWFYSLSIIKSPNVFQTNGA